VPPSVPQTDFVKLLGGSPHNALMIATVEHKRLVLFRWPQCSKTRGCRPQQCTWMDKGRSLKPRRTPQPPLRLQREPPLNPAPQPPCRRACSCAAPCSIYSSQTPPCCTGFRGGQHRFASPTDTSGGKGDDEDKEAELPASFPELHSHENEILSCPQQGLEPLNRVTHGILGTQERLPPLCQLQSKHPL
jgi:hypothetical protein